VRDRAERMTTVVAEGLEFRLEALANTVVVGRPNSAAGLTARDVEEEPAVVTAFSPRNRALPVDEVRS